MIKTTSFECISKTFSEQMQNETKISLLIKCLILQDQNMYKNLVSTASADGLALHHGARPSADTVLNTVGHNLLFFKLSLIINNFEHCFEHNIG